MLLTAYGCVDALSDDPSAFPLSEDRLKKLERLRPPQKRRQSIGAELLLIRLLKRIEPDAALPLSIASNENGRPFLQNGSLHFSLSHSGSLAVCALSDREIGVDIQRIKPVQPSVLRRCMLEDEQKYVLSASDRDRAFTRIWSMKESYTKARGLGLRFPLDSFSVLSLPMGAEIWCGELDGYALSLCCLDGPAAPELLLKEELS